MDQSSEESHKSFASELVKQLSYIEQQIAAVTGGSKSAGGAPRGVEGQPNKVNNHKNMRGGSPALARRSTVPADSSPPSPAALRYVITFAVAPEIASYSLHRQGAICAERKAFLVTFIFCLLGSQVVHEDADISVNAVPSLPMREPESFSEVASSAFVDSSSGSLFDRLLLVFHGLLSTYPPSWPRPASKTINEPTREFSGIDRELLETLQNDLNRMQLPDTIRWHIQAAMPILIPSTRCSLSCQPPSVSNSALVCLQPNITNPGVNSSNSTIPQRNPVLSRVASNASGKSKQQDSDLEIDPWTLLEDGAGSYPSASNTASSIGSGNHANIRAASWLKGAVRVRRMDLTYVGAMDDDS